MSSTLLLSVRRVADVLLECPSDTERWLSSSEQARLARLRIAGRRQQYLAGHWLARCLLSQGSGIAATDCVLEERRDLPPAPPDHLRDWQLSLSHSGDWLACAIARAPIGIDIEQRGSRAGLHRFQHLLLNKSELPNSLDDDALLQRWVVKEAWIKRQHGSALPEQLVALQLHETDANNFDIQLLTLAHWHLGISSAANELVTLPQVDVQAESFWRIELN